MPSGESYIRGVGINSLTRLYCLIGDPVSKSISPIIHNWAYSRLRTNAVYLAFRVREDELSRAVEGLRVLCSGFNVTIPHKTSIIRLLDDLTHEAYISGSVNTVKAKNGELLGHNTDALAALTLLDKLGCRGGVATILGAGGAAKSVLYALWKKGFKKVYIHNRTESRAKGLAEGAEKLYGFQAYGLPLEPGALQESLKRSDLLVNATPLGMYEDYDKSLPISSLPEGLRILDLAYARGGTRLEREALRRRHKVANGVEFLVLQAAYAIDFWVGKTPPIDEMLGVAKRCLGYG